MAWTGWCYITSVNLRSLADNTRRKRDSSACAASCYGDHEMAGPAAAEDDPFAEHREWQWNWATIN